MVYVGSIGEKSFVYTFLWEGVNETLKGNMLQMKFSEIIWFEVKIDALKGGGECKIREMTILFKLNQQEVIIYK